MSTLTTDQDVLDEGRKNKLEDVDAPLREQIVKKLHKTVIEEKLPEKIAKTWSSLLSNRVLHDEKQKAWLNSWDQHLVSSTDGAFSGSSQLHIPMPFTVVKTMHARFIQALWQDPPFNVKPQNEASTDNVELVRDVMRYYLMKGANHNKGVGLVVDKWVRDWLAQGSGILKRRWSVEYSRFLDVEMVEEPDAPLFHIINGQEVALPRTKMVEREVERLKKCFDGPIVELVDLEDIVIDGGDGDPDAADSVIQRTWLTASQLWTLVDRKIFSKEAVEAIIASGPDRVDGALGADIKQERLKNAGIAQLDKDQDLDRYEILEAYIKADIDGSGINADLIVWVHGRTRECPRATYLYRVSKSGKRPFAKADFEIRKGQEFGVGLVEILYPLSKELDSIHNQRLDFGMLSVMPFGFYRSTSGLDPETIHLEPGALIPVDNPQTDVYFPNLGNRTSFGFQEEAAVQQMVERLTSISDLNLGLTTSQGATRTATGARALVGEMSSNLDVYLRRLNWGWERFLSGMLEDIQANIPKGLAFRLTGDGGADRFVKINESSEVYGEYDIEVSANSASSNSALAEQVANEILQMVLNPLALQLQIVTPLNLYSAYENLLRAKGVKDYSKFIQKPAQARMFTPEQIVNRVLRNGDVPLSPSDDLEGLLAYWEEIQNSDELLGQFTQEQTIAMARKAQEAEQMLQAVQAQQAQQMNQMQQHINANMAAPSPAGPISGGGQAPPPQMG